ncbi:hypothetical protein ABW21_db0200052 [Orbilia brochopaga]|nr:hypothetical protein ABW21_db0200052 [Drechslerella brochopaga]
MVRVLLDGLGLRWMRASVAEGRQVDDAGLPGVFIVASFAAGGEDAEVLFSGFERDADVLLFLLVRVLGGRRDSLDKVVVEAAGLLEAAGVEAGCWNEGLLLGAGSPEASQRVGAGKERPDEA